MSVWARVTVLALCVNMSVFSKSIYNVAEFFTPKNLLYLQYTLIYIIFLKMLLLNFTCRFLIRSSYPYQLMNYYIMLSHDDFTYWDLIEECTFMSAWTFVSLRAIIPSSLKIINVYYLTCELFSITTVCVHSVLLM